MAGEKIMKPLRLLGSLRPLGSLGSLGSLGAFLIPLFALLLGGCEAPPAEKPLQYSSAPSSDSVPVYRFAVHPLHNPQKLAEAYQPLVDHLNRQLAGMRIELEASRDYQAYEEKFRSRTPAILLPNPWQTLEAMKVGYRVIAMAGDAEDFKGIFIVRKDSGIERPADLKGRTVSYPSPTALAACIMPQYFLYGHGIDINRDIQNAYVGSQESSIMNVYLGQSAAGATWPPPWRLFQRDHPREAEQLTLIWETPPLMNNSVMLRDDVPAAIGETIRKTLLDLAHTPAGQKILAGMSTARFHAADNASYARVRDYIATFEREVRPVEKK
jgi:phosphonate transport system substrate-binding protein